MASILKVLDTNQEFLACSHVSKKGIGRELIQESKVISYNSMNI